MASASSAAPVHTPAGAIAVDGVLPSDLMIDILLRLPARPLCLLRAVCRSWRTLLSDPAFAAAHASRHPAPLVVGWRPTTEPECRPRLTVDHRLAGIAIDNGCLRLRLIDLESGAASFVPYRHQAKRLRDDGSSQASCAAVVLGRTASGEHKALRVHYAYCGQPQLSYVLTLSGGGGDAGWRESHAPPARITWSRPSDTRAAAVDGIAYFMTTPPRHHHVAADNFVGTADGIASFDLATEQWSPALLRGPWNEASTRVDRNDELRLAALNGYLVVVHDNSDYDTMDLWFHVGQAQWCRRFAIQYDRALQMARWMDPPWELDDERVAVWMRGCGAGGLKIYHRRTKVFQDVVKRRTEGFVVGVGVYTGGILSNYC
ncbi:hypothetical protein BS78_02G068800 [Paspalum vaginatum]|nr:hypothetical protein BS78_02G068800 [Paspalum vaginatum]